MADPVIIAVFQKLGGRAALGTTITSEADLARVVSSRLPLKALKHVMRLGAFTNQEIQTFVIPARTQRHRSEKRERLTIEESDRLVRITRIQALAEDVFGDPRNASKWLREPLRELSGKSPLTVARTEAGVRVVEQILAKIDWGAAA